MKESWIEKVVGCGGAGSLQLSTRWLGKSSRRRWHLNEDLQETKEAAELPSGKSTWEGHRARSLWCEQKMSFIDFAWTFGAILACADPHESILSSFLGREIASLSIQLQMNEKEVLCLDCMWPHFTQKRRHSWALMWTNFYTEIFLIKGHLLLMAEFKANFKKSNRFLIYYILFCKRFSVSDFRTKVPILK